MAKANAAKELGGKKMNQALMLGFVKVNKGRNIQKPKASGNKSLKGSRQTKLGNIPTQRPSLANSPSTQVRLPIEDADDAQIPRADPMLLDVEDLSMVSLQAKIMEPKTGDVSNEDCQDISILPTGDCEPVEARETDLEVPDNGDSQMIASPRAVWATFLNGAIAKKAAIGTPNLVDGGLKAIGEGAHQAVFSVKILPQHSSRFFEGPIRQVDKSEEAVQRFRREAAQYPIIRENTIVRCSDGKPLLYFIKGGMYTGLSLDEKIDLPERSINAIRGLTQVYRPPPPKSTDSRMQSAQRKIQAEKNGVFGRYVSIVFLSCTCKARSRDPR